MNIHDATEQAFRNGYEQGCKDTLNAILDNSTKLDINISTIVEVVAQQLNINIK